MDSLALLAPALALLVAAAFLAGVIDAIAGGGGVLTVPSLLAAGLPPHLALGTNKAQSVVGTLAALARFWRAGLVDRGRAFPAFAAACAGALLGTRILLWLSPALLRPAAVVLLVMVALWLAFRRETAKDPDMHPPGRLRVRAAGIALVLGAYDGFFGPGTGTFLVVLHARFLGDPLDRASANAKVANAASNLGALALFVVHDEVLWRVALPMALAQAAGGWLGSHIAIRHGARLVRRMVLLVVIVLAVKLVLELLGAPD